MSLELLQPLDAAGTEHDVDVAGLSLHYHKVDRVNGAGIPVIFTHGGGPGSTGWNNFLYNAPAFAERYTCYFYEAPLYGKSAKVPVTGPIYSWHAEKFLGFMDALKITRAHVVNQSMGSSIVIKAATLAPDRFDHLVLTGGQPAFKGIIEPMRSAQKVVNDFYFGDGGPTKEKMRGIIENMEFFDARKVTDFNVQSRFDQFDPQYASLLKELGSALRGQPESLIGEFSKVKARSLCVHGLHDYFGGSDMPMLMVNQFADARIYVMPHASHHVQTECAPEYNSVVLNFLP